MNRANINYLLVGGYAVAIHGYIRSTKDIDLWIDPDPTEASRLMQLLESLGFHPPIDTIMRLQVHRSVLRLGKPPMQVDIMTACDGCDWKRAWARRLIVDVEGLTVPVISLQDLRAAKQAVGRHRDLDDLENLPPAKDEY